MRVTYQVSYALNVAEASLARATGTAEKTIKSFFGGK